jgi:outer membrane biogenesis lipoprotein LolB
MNTAIIALLLLGLCLALVIGLLSALQKLKSNTLEQQADSLQRGPAFRDHNAGEYSGDQQGARSQFAWQSRSHSRAPD